MRRSIPCVRGISYGGGKADDSCSDAGNDDCQKNPREIGDEQIGTVWPGCGDLGCQLVKIEHGCVGVSHLRWPWREGWLQEFSPVPLDFRAMRPALL